MKLKNKKILVTGADGFIGSHLVEYLVSRGHQVKAFAYYNSFNSRGWLDTIDTKNEIETFFGDIRDPNGVRESMKGCDVVFHLAALIGIPFSYHSPDSYVDTNIKGTLNVLQAARDIGCERVIHTSTSEVYGTALKVPIAEDHPLQGQSPYSATKIGADQMALSFFRSFNTPVVIARPFNTYGPRQSLRAVIPTIILQMLDNSKGVELGSLSPTRDFNYVKDTVSGFESIAESDALLGDVANIGSNFEISISDTAKLIAENLGIQLSVEKDSNRVRPEKSEVERLWADNQKILKLTNWKPEFLGKEGFKEGLNQTIEWFKDPKNRSFYRDKSKLYNV